MEIMSKNEPISEDHHLRSLFLTNTSLVDHDFASIFTTDIVKTPQNPILLQNRDSEGNLCNITQTNPIDISAKPGTLEHVHVWQKNLKHTGHFSKNSAIFLPGLMKKCLG